MKITSTKVLDIDVISKKDSSIAYSLTLRSGLDFITINGVEYLFCELDKFIMTLLDVPNNEIVYKDIEDVVYDWALHHPNLYIDPNLIRSDCTIHHVYEKRKVLISDNGKPIKTGKTICVLKTGIKYDNQLCEPIHCIVNKIKEYDDQVTLYISYPPFFNSKKARIPFHILDKDESYMYLDKNYYIVEVEEDAV